MLIKSSYLDLYKKGKLEKRTKLLYKLLKNCELCPRKCRINRLKNEVGYCKMGKELLVSSFNPHFGEEKPLVGNYGSGTIFLTGCNLLCVYCQNYETSHYRVGRVVSEEETANFMLQLQRQGCHNINLVTPTHFTPQLVKSIEIGAKKGLTIPIVWNCSGYENVKVIKLLQGIVDIYLPDIKYGKNGPAKKYSNTPDYFERCKEAITEMYHQVGNLKLDKQNIAYKGLIVRHLVLPQNQAASKEVFEYLHNLSPDIYINIMDQYNPQGRAKQYKKLARRTTSKEVNKSIQLAKKLGLHKLDTTPL